MEEDRVVSEYNENLLKIRRLDEIWNACRRKILQGNIEQYKRELFCAERELKPEARRISKDNKKDYIKLIGDINTKIPHAKKKGDVTTHFNLLIQKEDLLREIQQEGGLGITHKNTAEDDWD